MEKHKWVRIEYFRAAQQPTIGVQIRTAFGILARSSTAYPQDIRDMERRALDICQKENLSGYTIPNNTFKTVGREK